MEQAKISVDPILLTYVAQTLGRVPTSLYDFQKIKNLACGGKPVYQKLIDPLRDVLPERLEIVRGDFSIIGKMSRLKKLSISAMPVNDFSFLKSCTALENLEISACGVIDCALLDNLKNLKRLSLLHCSRLDHMEDILKLFRLEMLSLEGSQISNADCFMNCRIREIHLPEHILNSKQAEKNAASEARKRSCSGVPFQPAKQKRSQYPYVLQDLDSHLWRFYKGAYGNVEEYIAILIGEKEAAPETFKLRRLDKEQKTNYELAFDNLCENLWHQMSFYSATWLVMPYLVRLMESWEKEGDLEWMFRGILAAGSCLATDVYGDKPAEADIYESYQNAIQKLRIMTIDFLAKNLNYVQEKETSWAREFAVAVLAILGEQKLAYMFFLSDFASCYIVCPDCKNCDEEIEFGYSDPSERIMPVEPPLEKWDGTSLDEVKLWLFNLFRLLGDREGEERLRFYFGTYTCPECGKEVLVLMGMEEYYLSE